MGKVGERGLAELTQGDRFVGLERLKPRTESELMPSANQRHTIFESEKVPCDAQITPVIAARQTQLCCRIRRGTSSDDDRTDRMAQQKTGTLAAGVPGVGSPVKKYPARE